MSREDNHSLQDTLLKRVQQAQSLAGTKPLTFPPRGVLLEKYTIDNDSIMREVTASSITDLEGKQHNLRLSSITQCFPPSVSSVAELRPAHLKDLIHEKHHRGRSISLTTISPAACSGNGVVIVGEDHNGDAVIVALAYSLNRKGQTDLPVGSTLLIKEPYLTRHLGSQLPSICVRHISDVVVESGHNGVLSGQSLSLPTAHLQDASFLKECGDDLFKQGNYEMAMNLLVKIRSAFSTL